ncbi:GNAT family N-acetyltransferase [Paenibacillus durus]|uniref:GCN5 family acetyltransferase n=1 Tax=Paenibacillus durus ATCC 35681 TaxID=1333534 RepID=A0A0F7F6V4_PAEDU|nr:GNAT family N-acetyltransferase [Paenibacillus durus]AKG33594.1 GCN5 family acetyltransferase [Paenibacillus durus ATCC 35681]
MTTGIRIEQVGAIDEGLERELAGLLTVVVEDRASVGFLPPLAEAEAAQYWRGVPGEGVILWVAWDEGRIAGSVQLHLALKPNGLHRAEIAKLMVHPQRRRRGIARLLMETAEAYMEAEDRTLLVLDTRAGDPSNLLYQSLGYVEAGRIPDYARSADGELHETMFYYKKL